MIEKRISKNVTAQVGFPDGHVNIVVATGIPLVGNVTLTLNAEELFRVGDVLNQAFDHLKKLGELQPRNQQAEAPRGRYVRRS